ncbi:MAG: hypothetical protein ABI874_09450, partial [Chloroflexota bacterium]
HYELASAAQVAEVSGEKILDELDVAIYEKQDGVRGALRYRLRVREALWKPLTPTISLTDYLPFFALWVSAFTSHVWRMEQPERFDQQDPAWDNDGAAEPMGDMPDHTPEALSGGRKPSLKPRRAISGTQFIAAMWDIFTTVIGAQSVWCWLHHQPVAKGLKRRWRDFRAHVMLAVGGVIGTLVFAWLVNGLMASMPRSVLSLLPQDWQQAWPTWQQQVPLTLIALTWFSSIAAALLVALALGLWVNKQLHQPHSPLHVNAVMVTTTWLALFVAPLVVIVYRFQSVLRLARLISGLAVVVFYAMVVSGWPPIASFELRTGLLASATVFAVSTALIQIWQFSLKSNTFAQAQNTLVAWLKALIVMAGAPLMAVVIYLLEWLSHAPYVGTVFNGIRQSIPQVLLDALKDIRMYLTDSAHAAQVRCVVEEQLRPLVCDPHVAAVHILTHSLGTVVGFDTLTHLGYDDGALIHGDTRDALGNLCLAKIKTFVTYGSPLNKMRLLAERVEANQADRPIMSGFDAVRFHDGTKLKFTPAQFAWLNFYTPNDAVSDVFTTYSRHDDEIKPLDYSTWSATDFFSAHGAYWYDAGFWHTVLQAAGIIYADPRGTSDVFHQPDMQR